MALVKFKAPALPLPSFQYDQGQQEQLIRALRLYFNQLDSLTPNQANSYRADHFYGGDFTGNFDGGTVDALLSAESKGRYFNANIKGRYDCRTRRVPAY